MRIIAEEEGRDKPLGLWSAFTGRIRAAFSRIPADAYIVAIIVLAASGAFGLGYLAGKDAGEKGELVIEQLSLAEADLGTSVSAPVPAPEAPAAMPAGGQYVASKTGKSYHLPWCGGAKQIKEENKVWFATKEEAEARGYKPAGNCPGI